ATDPVIAAKLSYLNIPFFIGRTVLYFIIWLFYAIYLSRKSAEQDATTDVRGSEALIDSMRSVSAPGLVLFTVASTFAFIDWIMSLEPHWFSTMFGILFLVGEV